MRNLSDWRVRAFYLGCLVVVPFLKFLVWNEYGFFYPEALAATGLLVLLCVVLGAALRGVLFYAFSTLAVIVMTTYPLYGLAGSPPAVPPWLLAAAIGVATWFAARRMKQNFFVLLAVFTWSGLPVDMVLQREKEAPPVHAAAAAPPHHVLWLIMDEHVGLAGFPANIPECASAREKLQQTLERYNFTLFPRAYSNYPVTTDSVASVLNQRLIGRPEELMPRAGSGHMRHYAIRRNLLFEELAAKGYHVVAWQHGAMRICPEQPGKVECVDYQEKLKWLHRAPGGWLYRFRWLVGRYQSADPYMVLVKGFFPFRFGLKITGPLALEGFWPTGVTDRVLSEPRDTLFVAHLLTPHSPYLYRRDGSIRPLEEWADDRADRRVGAQEYHDLYCRYCEQVEFVSTQVEGVLGRLEEAGLLDGMTVVIHGDHGSRILRSLAPGSKDESVSPELLDFTGEPNVRDLADRFSTLLAIKRAGAVQPAIRWERHSLLTFLSREVFGREPRDGTERADKVYLADSRGQFRAFDIQRYWR